MLSLLPIYQESGVEEWVTARQIFVPVGQLVFVDNGSMSYMDEALVEVVSVAVQRKRTPPKDPFFKRLQKWWNN